MINTQLYVSLLQVPRANYWLSTMDMMATPCTDLCRWGMVVHVYKDWERLTYFIRHPVQLKSGTFTLLELVFNMWWYIGVWPAACDRWAAQTATGLARGWGSCPTEHPPATNTPTTSTAAIEHLVTESWHGTRVDPIERHGCQGARGVPTTTGHRPLSLPGRHGHLRGATLSRCCLTSRHVQVTAMWLYPMKPGSGRHRDPLQALGPARPYDQAIHSLSSLISWIHTTKHTHTRDHEEERKGWKKPTSLLYKSISTDWIARGSLSKENTHLPCIYLATAHMYKIRAAWAVPTTTF